MMLKNTSTLLAITFLCVLMMTTATAVGPAPSAPPPPAPPGLPAAPAPPPPMPVVEEAPPPEAAPAEGTPPAEGASAETAPEEVVPEKPLVPIDQVQIQVWISETNEQGLRELGTNLQYTRVVRGIGQSGVLEQVSTNVFNPQNPTFNVTLPAPDQAKLPAAQYPILRPDMNDGPGNGIQSQSGAGLVTSVIDSGHGTIDGLFRGIEQKADYDLISKPELLVINNGTAEIHAGGQVPFQNVAYNAVGAGQLSVVWQNIGVDLKLQPLILPNDFVQLSIAELSVSDVARIDNIRGVDLPVFANRSQSGVVLVPSGQTLVIGGLNSRVIQKTERRVPIVGAIPLVGIAFRGRSSKVSNSHLLVFVRPTIVDLRDLSENARSALNFWQDRLWKNSERISKEIAVMQDE